MAEAIHEPQQLAPEPQDTPRKANFKNSMPDWALRSIIFILFLYFGTAKFKNDADAPWVLLFKQIGFGQGFRYFTGVLEIAGAFLVLASGTVEIGLAMLIVIMLGALLISLVVLHRYSEAFFP